MSYIVKNCPAIYRTCNDCSNNSGKQCQDITDCVLKRIVELCKEEQQSRVATNILSNKILQRLDIQEVE